MVKVAGAIQSSKAALRAMMLPRPQPDSLHDALDGPVIVAGMFRTGNGLGRAARACFEALQAEGMNPVAVDLSSILRQVDLETSIPLETLVQKNRGTLIVFSNPPELERALLCLGLRRWHNWRIIGAWAWELPSAPRAWQRQTRFVSEIWAPSQFVAKAFEARYNRPVRVVPHFVPPAEQENSDQGTGDNVHPVRVLTLADARSSLVRKNPAAAVRMFRAAFPGTAPAELVVKCRNLSLFPAYASELREAVNGDTRIRILDETLSEADHHALLNRSNIVLSAHRSEGFGLHLAEAMAQGKSVVATGWSGNLEFMSETSSMLLPYTLRPVVDRTGVYASDPDMTWADAEFDAAVEALRKLGEDTDLRERLGRAARAAISTRLGSAAYREALVSDTGGFATQPV